MNDTENLLDKCQYEIDTKISAYYGLKVSELKAQLLPSQGDNKASFVNLARKMLDVSNNQISLCDNKVDAVLKTIRLTGNEIPAESMSFMPVDFDSWTSCDVWEECYLYRYFKEKTLILFVFQQFPSGKRVEDNEMTFSRVKLWKMSDYDLNHGLKEVWERVSYLVNSGELEITSVKKSNGKIINKNNLPSSKFNYMGHLRPGAINGADKTLLKTGQHLVKQRFWFNTSYVKEIIEQ